MAKGLSRDDVFSFLTQNYSYKNALTFSMYYSNKTAKCIYGSTFSADLTQNGHTYVITSINAQNQTVTFVDPNNKAKTYTMSWEKFANMGIGMVSSTNLDNINVHKQKNENKYTNQEIIDLIYENFGPVDSDTISLEKFTDELFADTTSLYNVALALIQQKYPGAKDLSNFKDVLLNIASSANYAPETFVNLLSEALSNGSFDVNVEHSTHKKNLYTELVTKHLLSLFKDNVE